MRSGPSIAPAYRCNHCANIKFWVNLGAVKGTTCWMCEEGIFEPVTVYSCPTCATDSVFRDTVIRCIKSHAKEPQLTSAEHTAKAEEYLRQAEELNEPGTYMEKRLLSFAQVHATLAVVMAGVECLNQE